MKYLGERYSQLKGKNKKGFTLIELVTVIAILAILALITVPNLTAYIAKADEAKIRANMKNIHTAAELTQQTDGLDLNDSTKQAEFIEKATNYSNSKDLEIVQVSDGNDGFVSKTYTLSRDEAGTITVRYEDKNGKEYTFNGGYYTKDGGIVDEDTGEVSDPVDWYVYWDFTNGTQEYVGTTLSGFNNSTLEVEHQKRNPLVGKYYATNFGSDRYYVINPSLPSINPETGKSITYIQKHAFAGAPIMTVALPDNLTTIGEGAFSRTQQLTSFSIPDSVVNIGDAAFQEGSLEKLTLGKGVEDIGKGAFAWNKLTSLSIPDNVVSIGQQAFSYNNLNSLTIGKGVEDIGFQAFYVNQLTSINFHPDSAVNIGDSAFQASYSLNSLTIGSGVRTIGPRAFSKDLFSPEGAELNNIKEVIIQEGVTHVDSGAFDHTGMTKLTIPASLDRVGVTIGEGTQTIFQNRDNKGEWAGTWELIDGEWTKQ